MSIIENAGLQTAVSIEILYLVTANLIRGNQGLHHKNAIPILSVPCSSMYQWARKDVQIVIDLSRGIS